MDPEVDIYLPFSRIQEHPPQGTWTNTEVWFNSNQCLNECSKWGTANFSLSWDEEVATNSTAQVIGYVTAVAMEDPVANVPMEFRQYLEIMSQEAAEALPEHRPYDCKSNSRMEARHHGDTYIPYRRRNSKLSEND